MMSVDQYQRELNSLDHDISLLEKKKAASDKKAAEEAKKANSITISKNASESTIRSKLKEIERHKTASTKASADSAGYADKIANKRRKRDDVYIKLQKEQQKHQKEQIKYIDSMRQAYEERISELESQALPSEIKNEEMEKPNKSKEYDVFVSHAWEDKESFVNELVDAMREEGLIVWYDTNEMHWGDSMRQRIDEGLKKSRFGIIVLSPNYIAEGKYWTKEELNGLFQKESVNGKTILPIWYNLNKKDVLDYSPMIADKKAMTTATMTAQEIAAELAHLMNEEAK